MLSLAFARTPSTPRPGSTGVERSLGAPPSGCRPSAGVAAPTDSSGAPPGRRSAKAAPLKASSLPRRRGQQLRVQNRANTSTILRGQRFRMQNRANKSTMLRGQQLRTQNRANKITILRSLKNKKGQLLWKGVERTVALLFLLRTLRLASGNNKLALGNPTVAVESPNGNPMIQNVFRLGFFA